MASGRKQEVATPAATTFSIDRPYGSYPAATCAWRRLICVRPGHRSWARLGSRRPRRRAQLQHCQRSADSADCQLVGARPLGSSSTSEKCRPTALAPGVVT